MVVSLGLIVIPPDYDMTMLYVSPAVPEFSDLKYLVQRGFVRSDVYACLTDTHKPKHSVNKCFPIANRTQALLDPGFLRGTTYWYNEFMHIGHVPFDSVLIQLLKTQKIDRIIIQRAFCHSSLCHGVGTWRSFYAGYFAAVLEAANQPNVPIYLRWAWKKGTLEPYYVSTSTLGYENYNGTSATSAATTATADATAATSSRTSSISSTSSSSSSSRVSNGHKGVMPALEVKPRTCLQHVIRRGSDVPKQWGKLLNKPTPTTVLHHHQQQQRHTLC